MKEELPELPPSTPKFHWDSALTDVYPLRSTESGHYTADQMRAYGLECYRAGMEKAATIAEAFENPSVVPDVPGDSAFAEQMTELLRMYYAGIATEIRSAAQG
jgi:hypothetical protein